MEALIGNSWLWNTIIGIFEIIYIFVVIGLMDKLVTKGFPSDLSRKIIHIAAGSYVIFWPLFDATHWTKFFCVGMPLIWVLLFLSKGLSKNTDDPAVKTMTRTGDPRELLRGPLMFATVMVLIGLTLFNEMPAILALGMLTWGDGLAPYFGGKFGKITYKTLGAEKTLVGSATVLIAGFLGTLLMLAINGMMPSGSAWTLLAVSAAAAMIIEALSPRDLDNILIPGVVLIICGIWLGGF